MFEVLNARYRLFSNIIPAIFLQLSSDGSLLYGTFLSCCVLSSAVQLVAMVILQTVLDALRARKERFVFEDIEVTLKSTVMAFITMNPGYPGRAELPESLKVRLHTPGVNALG